MSKSTQAGSTGAPIRGMFVRLGVDANLCAREPQCRECAQSCPVDIFVRNEGETAQVVGANEDECILCDQCVERCPVNAVSLSKLY
ncbi:MAG: ferredoxin family protein [Dehalococcoidia bacterium]